MLGLDSLRNLRLGDITIDTTGLKAVDAPDSGEFRLRAVVNAIFVVALVATLQMWGLAVWYLLRFSYLVAYLRILHRLPDRLTLAGAAGFGLLTVIESFSFVALSLFFWQYEHPVFKAFAMTVIAASMIATMWTRARAPFLWICDAIAITICMLSLPVLYVISGEPVWHGILMAIVFSTVVIYFVLGLYSIWMASVELERAQQVEVQRSRVEAMGRLTGGVAHDFNNLLTVILGNIELARMMPNGAERDQMLSEAEAAGRRAARLTAQLLGFARQSVLSPRRVQLMDCVIETRALLGRLLPANVRIETAPELAAMPEIHLDPGKMEAVIINLAINARDAMPDGGRIRFDAEVVRIEEGATASPPTLAPGRYVAFDVRDTGTGIPSEILEQVTEPFFTTKEIGKGSGLGLSMAKGFAEQSGGALVIESAPGSGTCVRIYIPVAEEAERKPIATV